MSSNPDTCRWTSMTMCALWVSSRRRADSDRVHSLCSLLSGISLPCQYSNRFLLPCPARRWAERGLAEVTREWGHPVRNVPKLGG